MRTESEHRSALWALVHLTHSTEMLKRVLNDCPNDFQGVPVHLTVADLREVLQRAIDEEISLEELSTWADLLEVRSGIARKEEDAERIQDVLFQLSTPEINEPLSIDLLKKLRQALV